MFSCSPFTIFYVFSLEMESENQAACILASSDFAKITPSQLPTSLSNHSNFRMPLGEERVYLDLLRYCLIYMENYDKGRGVPKAVNLAFRNS